ncbi:hypothetical protein [Richelia intracellularis]|uniref:hypothetical protein n=1 Tax=Richelia intracellularis TaxID=1164990 RepID=UPI0005C7D3A8|nr:hypothetical protein [Richelia intracellularis]
MDNVLDDLDVDKCEECNAWTTTANCANIREHNGTLRTLCTCCTQAMINTAGCTEISFGVDCSAER